jgi:hypothetical protein
MDDELKDLFFDAIDHFPLEQRDAAQRWLSQIERDSRVAFLRTIRKQRPVGLFR